MIKQIRIKPQSEEWYSYRMNGFGASEIASVCAIKSRTLADLVYQPPIKLFLSKCGEQIQEFTGNVSSEGGRFFESIICNFYRFYDLDNSSDLRLAQLEMYKRIRENKRVNKLISPKVYVTNSKYDWLFFSPDGFAWKNGTGKKRLIEIKCTTSMETRRYQNLISPSFYMQCQMGLMLSELDHADLAIWVDGTWLTIVTIEPNKEMFDFILECSHEFWQKILAARKIKKDYELVSYFGVNPDFFTEKQKEGIQMLSDLEPSVIGSDAEVSFIKSMIVPSETENPMIGTEHQEKLCQQYNALKDEKDNLDIKTKEIYIELIRSLEGHNKAEFASGGYFSYRADKNNRRSIYVSPKIIASDAINN